MAVCLGGNDNRPFQPYHKWQIASPQTHTVVLNRWSQLSITVIDSQGTRGWGGESSKKTWLATDDCCNCFISLWSTPGEIKDGVLREWRGKAGQKLTQFSFPLTIANWRPTEPFPQFFTSPRCCVTTVLPPWDHSKAKVQSHTKNRSSHCLTSAHGNPHYLTFERSLNK